MSVYKQQGSSIWWISFSTKGKRVRCSSGTSDRKAAEELHDRMKVESWRAVKLGVKERRTWMEAAVRWVDESAKRSISDDVRKLRWLNEKWDGKHLDEITKDLIRMTVESRDCTHPTKNRYYALIRAIMRRAVNDWEWIDVPPRIKLHKEAPARVRYLEPDEALRLLEALPDHLQGVVEFALATGLRMSNILQLQWRKVDMKRRHAVIEGQTMKNGQPLGVPLNDPAMSVLGRLRGQHPTHVFTYMGKPFKHANADTFRDALKAAGIKDFRFHDLRHTWASWARQNGADTRDLQELGGWKTPAMAARYQHLSSERLMETAKKLNGVVPSAPLKLVVGGE